ncbi:MAG: M1 family metallopeptidase [Dokdonella sp.]|uniref:M1 family metallopeptidase n=1 Tax=Dokdonella sp. TaxID=2291710 RepID=UPI0032649BBB
MSAVLRVALLLLLVACPVVAIATSIVEAPPTGKLPTDASPQHYALHLTIDPRLDRFEGETRIRVVLSRPMDHVWIHAKSLTVTAARVIDAAGNATPVQATAVPDAALLKLAFARTLQAQEVELVLAYTAPFNAQLEGLYKVKVGDDSYAVSQMEPASARFAFPGFDEPRFKTPFDIVLTVPKGDVAVSNTRQLREEVSKDDRWKTLTFATTKPLPTYLVAFAVGPWEVVDAPAIAPNAVRKTAVPLRGIGPRGTAKQLAWALEVAPSIVTFFEEYTQQPYPFDKLDVLGAPDFAAGAMENAGLIIYRDAYLLIDAHAAADRYRRVFNIEAHEIAHQWYGDLVTVPWWDDIWLNEAYATWAQSKATTALRPEYHAPLERLEARLEAMGSDSLLSTRKIRQPILGKGDIVTAFDGITYQKGAAVLGMFEAWVGEETFRKGMRAYLARHAFGSGSSDDLIATLAETSGKGETFAKAMRSFLDQPGVPLVQAEQACKNGKATLTLAQLRYLPFGVFAKETPRWGIPVCTRFGHGATSDTQCFLLEKEKQTFDVAGQCADWFLPNADARGYYRFDMTAADLARLGAVAGTLSEPEQLVYADAIASAFNRGTLGPAAVLDAMPALASSPMPQVSTALVESFEWIREYLSDSATRTLLDAYASRLYAPRLAELGYRRKDGEAGTATALRTRLADFLAIVVRDAQVRAELARQGRAALGLDGSGKVDLSLTDADLRTTALQVTVQDGGVAAFDAVLAELARNHDTTQRYALLGALGATRDAALAERARNFGLTPAVQIGEMARLYDAQVEQPENRSAMWTWLQAHFDAYRVRVPAFAQAYLPKTVADGRCSNAAADELVHFFEPRLKDLIGGGRGLGQTVERIRQCGGLREKEGTAALKAWAERQPSTGDSEHALR